jgi:hypothetical protein
MKRLIFAVLFCVTVFGLVSAQKTLTIEFATKPIVADGIINASDPWAAGKWVDVTFGKATNVGDMTAKFQLMYDETNLYFGVQVNDANRFTGNATTHLNDCVEFFIAMDTTSGAAGTYKQGDKQMRLQAVADPTATGGAIDCRQTAPPSGTYKVRDNGSDYVQEWTLPWAELSADMDPAWDQKQFKFDVLVSNSESSGGREQLMFWNDNSDLQWNNTTKFGLVTLATPIPALDPFSIHLGPDKIIVCGDSLKLNPSVMYNGSGILTYSWSPSEGLSATNIPNPVAFTKTNKTYTLTVTSSDLGTVTKSVMIIVNPLTLDCGADKTIICGSNIQLNNPITNYTGIGTLEFSWSPTNGLSSANVARPTADVIKNTSYKLEVTNPNGCKANDSLMINVNPLTVNCGPDKTIICGGNTQLNNPVTNYSGSGTLTYSWLPATGLSTANIAQPTAEVTTNTSYNLEVTTPNGCIANDDILINVNPLTTTVNNPIFSCGNKAQIYLSTNYTGLGTLTYNWIPSTGLSASNISNPLADLISNTDYYVEVVTPNGCFASNNVSVNSAVISYIPSICMVTVDENQRNVIVINKEQNSYIDSFLIYRESANQINHYDLIGKLPYSENAVFLDSETNAKVQSTKYKTAVKDVCGFVTEKGSEHKTVYLSISQGIGNNWNLSWEPYIGVTISKYKILRGTSKSNLTQIASVDQSSTSYIDLTTLNVYYQIEVLLPQACNGIQSNQYTSIRSNLVSNFDETIGIFNNSVPLEFLYPNPAFDKLFVRPDYSANAIIVIYNLQGKQVLNRQITEQIDISNLSKGLYIVKLIESGKVLVNKLVKE